MSGSEIAALIAAIAFAVLVIAAAIPLLKLGAVFGRLEKSIDEVTAQAVATLSEAKDTVNQVNVQMEKVDSVTSAANRSVQDISALTTLVSATLGRPLIKIAAFSYGVRRVLGIDKTDTDKTGTVDTNVTEGDLK